MRRRDDRVGVYPVQPEQVHDIRALAKPLDAQRVDGVAFYAA